MKREVEIFVGPCSKWIDGVGWVTKIPIQLLKDKGYIKIDEKEADNENT